MTTPAPTPAAPAHDVVSGTVRVDLRATAPVHHGAGTSGNTALLRTQDTWDPAAGRWTRVPYVSGNSLRHTLRDALAWHLATTLPLAEGTLTKLAADLLWTGGALTAPGAQVDLDTLRARHAALPHLPLLGYSAVSDLVAGTLAATHAHLVCADNTWRLPPDLAAAPEAARPAADWTDEDFGTRHDVSGSPVDRLLAPGLVPPPTTQMIYEHQVVRAGALWTFTLTLRTGTRAQADALLAAVHLATTRPGGWTLGAKAGNGYGTTAVARLDTGGLGDPAAALAAHTAHVTAHADAVRDVLAALR